MMPTDRLYVEDWILLGRDSDMMIFEKARENAEAIRRGGARAIEQAKMAGVPAYYVDRAVGDGFVREMPDGTRQRIQLIDGVDFVVETLAPRTQSSK